MSDRVDSRVGDEVEDVAADGVAALRERTGEFETLLDRSRESRVKQWMLLTGRRSVVASGLLVAVFVVIVGLSTLNPVDVRQLLTNTTTIQTLFSSLLSGAILLVSIVVSISSVVLSQEITSLDEQADRIDASMAYREHIEEVVERDVSPTRPAEFLQVVLQSLATKTKQLSGIAADSSDREFRDDVDQFSKRLIKDAKQSATTLDGTQFGSAKVLLAGLNYDYSWQLNAARQLRAEYADTLSDEGTEVLADLIDTLKLFATGQAYFNSLYYKRELARLSNTLLYVSLPVIIITSYVLLALDAKQFPEVSVLGLSPILLAVGAAYTVALAPYVVLTVYVLRAGTVTLRTLAAGPFILQKTAGSDEGAWEASVDTRDWEVPDIAVDPEESDADADTD